MYAPDIGSVATPIGFVVVEGDADTVRRVRIATTRPAKDGAGPAVREAVAQVAAYFVRRLTMFDLPLAPSATTRGAVLRQAIVSVGHGRTASYGDLASHAGSSPGAVGQACATNPFPLIVPCHRVLPADGSLGPYSAGDGPDTKRWLLAFEGAMLL